MYDYKATGATILHSVRRFVLLEDVDEDEGRSNEELESARLRVKSVQRKSTSARETTVAAYTLTWRYDFLS